MSAKPSSFLVTNLKRAVQGVKLAGVDIGRIEVDGAKFTIIPKDREAAVIKSAANEWDGAFSGKPASQVR
jgi:hypothetical protein